MTDGPPNPWAIDPEHGRVTGPGFLGDSFHSLRVRELLRYYQPPSPDDLRHVAPINTGNDFVKESGLLSAVDPILAAFANLTTRVMDMRRCVVSMTGSGTSYVIAESTRTLSLTYPHTHEPGDALMLGGGVATSSLGGLCEHTCSLLPPPPDSDEPFLLEIPDLSKHPKFYNVGYVRNWPHARFYCGAPLRTRNGVTIGTVCVMDDRTRYDGLTDRERLIMSNMAELFMQYFETKEASRFRKKGQVMEMELSRFISEGYLPTEGSEMVERRGGRLWSESILQSKRRGEEERRAKVLAKRQMLQEMEYAKMVRGEPSSRMSPASVSADRTDEHGPSAIVPCELGPVEMGSPSGNSDLEKPRLEELLPNSSTMKDEPPYAEHVPVIHPLQPGIIEMVPVTSVDERVESLAAAHAALPQVFSGPKEERGMVDDLTKTIGSTNSSRVQLLRDLSYPSIPEGRMKEAVSPSTEHGTGTEMSLSLHGAGSTPSEGVTSTTAATSMQSQATKKKRSKYEESASMEPHLRAMFARASTVIKNTLDCDVVFVHSDLEGFFEPELAESDPHTTEWSWSHVSSDNKSEQKVRANRPKQHRQRSGILGYATSKGSSSARFDGPKKITDLGFDMSELRQEHLTFLLRDSKGGRIFSFFDEYPGLEEHEDPEELECKRMLRKFLPGCRNVIIVPLHDHNHVLTSVCFAWTCSDQRTFYGDEEGRFASGVAASLMDEMARMHILSADKAKSEFISSISHELRSPLHGILASSEFLIDDDLRPHQRSFVETILSCGTTLLDTVNHVLDFQKLNFLKDEKIARIEAPSSPDEELSSGDEQARTPTSTSSSLVEENLFDKRAVDIDLSSIVQEVTEGVVLGYEFKDLSKVLGQAEDVKKAALHSATKVSNIQVVVDIDALEGGWVFRSSPAAFKRIVGNIVGNAIKYSHEKGWIKITLTAKKIDPTPNGAPRAKVVFIVSDSGKGMSREFLKTRLFTPFTQENPMAPGSGLGLSIVRQLVDVLGGKIDVKSQLGKGTTFRIEMKLTQTTRGKKATTEPSGELVLSKIRRKKAFLVGFERFEHCETAEKRGETLLYDSVTRYARELLHIDIVSDPEAPDVNECEFVLVNELSAATRLHELPFLKDRPIVVMCNSTPRRSILENFPFDRDSRLFIFLRKPCGPKKLLRAFQVCLDILEKGLPNSPSAHDPSAPVPPPRYSEAADPAVAPLEYKAEAATGFTSLADLPLAGSSSCSQKDAASRTDNVSQRQQSQDLSPQYPLFPRPGFLSSATSPAVSSTKIPQIETFTRSDMPAQSPTPATAPVVATPSSAREQPSLQPRILCVEDNKINMMLVTTYLKKKKYPFEMAFDGAEALEKVKEGISHDRSFDCILMDLQMPIMSGIESTREIRALERQLPDQHKPAFIIALTGLAAGSDREEAFDAGVDAFMVKPVSFKDLEKMLKQHVREGVRDAGRRGVPSSIVSVESERGKNIEIKKQVISASIEVLGSDVGEQREAG